MTNTDLSILAMIAAQPNGVAKTGGLIAGDGAFLAFLGQKTVAEQQDNQPLIGDTTVPLAPLISPQVQLGEVKTELAAASTPPAAPEAIQQAPLPEAEPIRNIGFHSIEKPAALPIATTAVPLIATPHPPTQAPPMNEALLTYLPMTDKVATTPQDVDLIQNAEANVPVTQPERDAALAAHDATEQSIAQSEGAETILLPQAPLSLDQTPKQAPMIAVPRAKAPEPPLEPARKVAPMAPHAPSVIEQAIFAPLADIPPKAPIQPVSTLAQLATSGFATAKATTPVSDAIESTAAAAPTTKEPAQFAPVSVENSPVTMVADAEPASTFALYRTAPPPRPNVTGPRASVIRDVGAPQNAAPLTFFEKGSVANAAILSMGKTQPVPAVVVPNAEQSTPFDLGSLEATTSQATPPKSIVPPNPVASAVPPAQPNQIKAQLPQNAVISYTPQVTKTVVPASAVLPNAVASMARNVTQAAPKPIAQNDAPTLAPTVPLGPEARAMPTAVDANQLAQIHRSPPTQPEVQQEQSTVFDALAKPSENSAAAGTKNTSLGTEKQITDSSPKAPAIPQNGLMTSSPERPEPVQTSEKASFYNGAFTQTGFSPSIATPTTVQTPTAQTNPVPVSAIAEQIITHARAEKPSAIELTLTPDDLGKIRLFMAPDGDKIRIFVHADRPETLELIRRNTESFSADLRQAGYSNASFSFSGSNGRQSTQQDRENTKNGFDSAHDDQIAPPTPKPATNHIKLSGLNLRV